MTRLLVVLCCFSYASVLLSCQAPESPGTKQDQSSGENVAATAGDGSHQRTDILVALQALPGVTVTEVSPRASGARSFDLTIEQQVDHTELPDAVPPPQTFRQRIRLLHRSEDLPVVLATTGYHLGSGRDNEVSLALGGANVVDVEQRFFAASTPQPARWEMLTIKQGAADHHQIVETLKTIYSKKWISTGISKGGMTSVYHRRFYPDDVAGTIAYVAPHSYGTVDARYEAFLETLGSEECRNKIITYQREVLARRDEVRPIFEAAAVNENVTFDKVGGIDAALEFAIQEFRFALWQYGPRTACDSLPGIGASANALAQALDRWSSPAEIVGDQALESYAAFNYQVANELGYYGPLEQHLGDLLRFPGQYVTANFVPQAVTFDDSVMPAVQRWLSSRAQRIVFIYGENDPWTAGAFSLGGAQDTASFVAKNGNHGASMARLLPAERQTIREMLGRWTDTPLRDVNPARDDEAEALADEAVSRPRHEQFRMLR
jgi:hypothetical protein